MRVVLLASHGLAKQPWPVEFSGQVCGVLQSLAAALALGAAEAGGGADGAVEGAAEASADAEAAVSVFDLSSHANGRRRRGRAANLRMLSGISTH